MAGPFIYLGVNGNVFALDRATGESIWCTHLAEPGINTDVDLVNLFVDGDLLIATTAGMAFAMDAGTGTPRWRNDLPGQGTGWVTIATAKGSTGAPPEEAPENDKTQTILGAARTFGIGS